MNRSTPPRYELLAPAQRAGKKKAAVGQGLAVWEELSL
jgi:hypothetical protein